MFLSDVRFPSSPGSNKHIEFSSKVLKDGSIELVRSGVTDTDAMIESHRAGTELKNLLVRFQNGDLSALNQVNGFYADVTGAPSDTAVALQYVMNAQSTFDSLPIDQKRIYDNDFRKWIADFGSVDWLKNMKLVSEAPADPEKPSDPSSIEKETKE